MAFSKILLASWEALMDCVRLERLDEIILQKRMERGLPPYPDPCMPKMWLSFQQLRKHPKKETVLFLS